MRVLTVGGGSGGHVTPVRAVINELSRHDPKLEVRFICDRRFSKQAGTIMSHARVPVKIDIIAAGKLRRYHGVSLRRQLSDIPTLLLNIRDLFLVGVGALQSLLIVMTWRPDVVFTKGGFVCLPVGFVAHLTRTPLVIHDSDAHPGLTNRILARWATYIATGAPLENYNYPANKSTYVGIPVAEQFRPYTPKEQTEAKAYLGMVDITKPLVVVTGGGLGAKRINDAMVRIGSQLIQEGICVYHVTGDGQYDAVTRLAPDSVDYITVPFVSQRMHDVLGAADVVVTRAGATTLLELAALAKPVIIVPNPMLTGGHQTKNAAVYAAEGAAVVVDEDSLSNTHTLYQAIVDVIQSPTEASSLGKKLHAFTKKDAALDVAGLIAKAVSKKGGRE